jgi:hypothetical protein
MVVANIIQYRISVTVAVPHLALFEGFCKKICNIFSSADQLS